MTVSAIAFIKRVIAVGSHYTIVLLLILRDISLIDFGIVFYRAVWEPDFSLI